MESTKPKPDKSFHSQSRAEYKENILQREKRAFTLKQESPPENLRSSQPIVPGNRTHIKFKSPSKKGPKMTVGNKHMKFISSIKEPQKGQNEDTNPANPTNYVTSSLQKGSQSQEMIDVVKKTKFVQILPDIMAPVVEEDKNRFQREGSPSKIARAEKKRKNRQAKREKQKLQREAKEKASRQSKDDVATDDIEDVEMADVVESEKEEHSQNSKTHFMSSPRSNERINDVEKRADFKDNAEVEVEVEVEMNDKYGLDHVSASEFVEFSEYVDAIDDSTEDTGAKDLKKTNYNAAYSQMAYYEKRFRRYFVRFRNWSALISGGSHDHQILDILRAEHLRSQQDLEAKDMMAFLEKYWAICCFNIDTVISKGWYKNVITKGEGMLKDLMRMYHKLLKDENIWIVGLRNPFHDFSHNDDHYEERVKLKLGLSSD